MEATNIYKLLAQRLHNVADVVIGYYWPAISNALLNATKDKALKVQTGGNEAMKEWLKLKKTYEEIQEQKMTPEKPRTGGSILNKHRDARKLAKQQSEVSEDQIPATWGSAARAANFLRKKEGLSAKEPIKELKTQQQQLDNDYVLREISEDIQEDSLNERMISIREEDSKIDIEENSESVYNAELAKCSRIHPPQVFYKDTIKPLNNVEDLGSDEVTFKKVPLQNNKPHITQQLDTVNIQTPHNYKEEALKDTIKVKRKVESNESCEMSQNVSDRWMDAKEKLKAGRAEDGYKTILDTEDDLYLLSIMENTGPVTLPIEIGESVIRRANQIVRSNTIPRLILNWIQEAITKGNFHKFNKKLQNELLDTLHQLSQLKSELSKEAKDMYEHISNHYDANV